MGIGCDVVVVGGGHNALVAATYLARAGLGVMVFEARAEFGGAVASTAVFPGIDVRLSRFAYLVSLLPESIAADLGLRVELRSRRVASYTPVGDSGLLIERRPGPATRASFRALTGGDDEWRGWTQLEERLGGFARAVAPTLVEPLPSATQVKASVEPSLWQALTERPIGELIETSLADDTVRGVMLTDALIGVDGHAWDTTLRQNRCFLYHVIGNGTGEWKVPVGGMGAVAAELTRVARLAGAELRSGTPVSRLRPGVGVELADGTTVSAPLVLAGCAPATLSRLVGDQVAAPEGCQTKINLVVRRLPRLRSGLDPETAFAGTLHLGQGYQRLGEAYAASAAGQIPDPLPCEVYCHTLTDPTILGDAPRAAGWHTLTLFGLHTPARLFAADPDAAREQAAAAALHTLQAALAEPLTEVLALDAAGQPCIEVMSPLDVQREVGMPGGHIFHGDLAWPWRPDEAEPATPAERWGVATPYDSVLVCGSGAVRGGAVSGLGGHNAAQAVLASR